MKYEITYDEQLNYFNSKLNGYIEFEFKEVFGKHGKLKWDIKLRNMGHWIQYDHGEKITIEMLLRSSIGDYENILNFIINKKDLKDKLNIDLKEKENNKRIKI